MRRVHLHEIRRRVRGWTLIELLGILSLLVVLSVVAVPLLMREMDGLAREREAREMVRIADAVEQGIRRQRTIPDATVWAEFVAAESGRRVEEMQTNARGVRRLWIVDPRLRVGVSPGATLPFIQTLSGSMEPVSARILLVSSLGESPPATVRDGVATSSARFDAIWAAGSGTVPTGWSWSGRGDDLFIQRILLSPLFVPVFLNQYSNAPVGRFGVDGAGTNAVPVGVFHTWYLHGTVLRLHGPDGGLQVSSVLQETVSLGFERGAWRAPLSLPDATGHWAGAAVDAASDRFLSAPGNPAALGPDGLVAPPDFLLEASNYLAIYREWSVDGFSRGGTVADSMRRASLRMNSASASLILPP